MSELTRPALNLKQAYERVKSKLTGVLADIAALWPIAKNSAGNGIYNGKMTISQRGDYTTDQSMTSHGLTTGDYFVDRFYVNYSDANDFLQHSSVTLPDGSVENAIKYTTKGTTSSNRRIFQKVEGWEKYKGKTITVSQWYRGIGDNLRITTSDGVDVKSKSLVADGEWHEAVFTVTLSSSITSFAFLTGIMSAAAGATTGVVGDYIEFTDVRLDLGSHRLSGDREYGEELALCQRYGWPLATLDTLGGDALAVGQCYSTTTARVFARCPVPMRSTPTVIINNVTYAKIVNAANSGVPETTNITLSGASDEKVIALDITAGSGLAAGNATTLTARDNSNNALSIFLSAEL